MFLFTLTIFLSGLLGIIYGGQLKFQNENIRIKKGKTHFFFALPMKLMVIHFRNGILLFRTSKGEAIKQFFRFFLKYPIQLGIYMELLLFHMEENRRDDPDQKALQHTFKNYQDYMLGLSLEKFST